MTNLQPKPDKSPDYYQGFNDAIEAFKSEYEQMLADIEKLKRLMNYTRKQINGPFADDDVIKGFDI